MTHTLTVDSRENIGRVVICYGKIDITSYTAAGEVIDPSEFQFKQGLKQLILSPSENGYTAWYTASNDKVVVRGTGTGDKAAGTAVDAATDVGEIPYIAIGV